jgi:hypothetical protein
MKNWVDSIGVESRRDVLAYEETIKGLREKIDGLIERLVVLENREHLAKSLESELGIMRQKYAKDLEENRNIINKLQ